MAPTMMNNPLIFAEAYDKSNTTNDSVTAEIKNVEKRVEVSTKKISKNSLNHEEKAEVKHREYPAELPGPEYCLELVWRNIIIFILLHIGAVYGYMAPKKYWGTVVFTLSYGFAGGFGITAGSHRLFAHRAYKANTALKILLLYFQTIAFQNSVYEWARDHRVHHKFCDTNADPHNSRRGFFFSHMGWLLCKKHPDVKKFGAKVDMSDLEADPYIMFQHKYYLRLMLLVSVFIPTMFVWIYYEETFLVSFFLGSVYRYVVSLHITWLINSAAHMWGMKPFDKNISPSDTKLVAFLAFGEGWHNFHHVFPWDYKTSELGTYCLNFSTAFLDFFAWLGWATELKTVSDDLIQKRILRTGDGSHKYAKMKTNEEKMMAYVMERTTDENGNHIHHEEDTIWGWGDKEMPEEDKKYVTILNKNH